RPVPLAVGLLEGCGFLIGLIALCLLLARLGTAWNTAADAAHGQQMWGGALGRYLLYRGSFWLGDWGSVLAALAGLLCCVVLTTRLSLRDVLGVAGAAGQYLVQHSMATGTEVAHSLKEHWLQRREAVAQSGAENHPAPRTPKGRGDDRTAAKPGAGGTAGAAEEEMGTFRSKPAKPKIQRPGEESAASAPAEEQAVAEGDKVVSLARKRKERETTPDKGKRPEPSPETAGEDPAAAADDGEESAGSGPAAAAPEETPIYATDDYDPAAYQLPPLTLLAEAEVVATGVDDAQMLTTADVLVRTLGDFGIDAKVETITPGPVVTLYELLPAPGVPVNKFVSRQDDLKLALAAKSIRIVAPIPGKSAVGIEVPNKTRANVYFKEIAESAKFRASTGLLKVVLGKDALGAPNFLELDKMPHLLIAGATGSGKSVCIHGLLTSLLFHAAPHQLKLVLIDPKQVEMTFYKNIPHLLTPIITDAKDATRALKWLCAEMDNRYETLANATCRDITRYNELMTQQQQPVMPFIVVVIDELADLMAVAAQECEASIARLTAKARAVGVHLVLATQRPSVDVITGLIKANLPARIAFAVLAKVDSRTILDQNGADTLLGNGDMLFQDPRSPAPM
ncbi:MAG TPA: DNA translocase FtsK, partial [bacterium]|nr:DNA translocase FtsK [bacterium]